MNRHQIEAKMAVALKAGAGVDVEVTLRCGAGAWTVSGAPGDVEEAVRFLAAQRLMTEESRAYDEELGESFSYLRSA